MNPESEVATLLRADGPLVALLPGGIYAAGDLGEAGITDPQTTPHAYLGGRLRPCAVVHARAPVPVFQAVSFRDGLAGMRQAIEVYTYARRETNILPAIQQRVYSLLHGRVLTKAWPVEWVGSLGPFPAPELPEARMMRSEYRIVAIRRPVSA